LAAFAEQQGLVSKESSVQPMIFAPPLSKENVLKTKKNAGKPAKQKEPAMKGGQITLESASKFAFTTRNKTW
jgi:hypothetical protein